MFLSVRAEAKKRRCAIRRIIKVLVAAALMTVLVATQCGSRLCRPPEKWGHESGEKSTAGLVLRKMVSGTTTVAFHYSPDNC